MPQRTCGMAHSHGAGLGLNFADGPHVPQTPPAKSRSFACSPAASRRGGPTTREDATSGRQFHGGHAGFELAVASVAGAPPREGAGLPGADPHGPSDRRAAAAVADLVGAVAGGG